MNARMLLLPVLALSFVACGVSTPESPAASATPQHRVHAQTTGYWGGWKLVSSDWAYTRTKCTWRNSYYQLNPSTGEYVVQSTKTVVNYSQPMLPGCPTPTD